MGVWVSRNAGLPAAALFVNYIIQNPETRHLDSVNHELWMATNGGVFRTFNGGTQWSKMPLPDPSNTEFFAAPVDVNDLNFLWIDYDLLNKSTLYSLAWNQASEHIWIYKTTSLGLAWTSRGIIPDLS